MGLPFYTMNRIQNSFDLTGYNDANGKYVSTQFYDAYVNGGIFFFDEIDASSPEALVTINTALAQGYMAFPNGLVKMHPDFKVVAAGNTFGKGANRQYCGRNSLDSATLDRFMIIEWDYDRELEAKIIKDKELLEFAWAVRPSLSQRTAMIAGSIEPERVPIIIPSRGVRPIVVSKHLPPLIAEIDEPLPRWQVTILSSSALYLPGYFFIRKSVALAETYLWLVPWKPYFLMPCLR